MKRNEISMKGHASNKKEKRIMRGSPWAHTSSLIKYEMNSFHYLSNSSRVFSSITL